MAEASNPPAWRIPKACQECRKRKIRCNGLNPCKACQLRDIHCEYRDFIRHRRKKHEYQEARGEDRGQPRRASPVVTQPSRRRNSSMMHNFPHSVSATHMASPSCQMQLYYGPTSHFALMQHIYRGLIPRHPEPSSGVDEAGAGLDLFSFRRIFFGTPDTNETPKVPGVGDVPVMFLPLELARLFLSRFLTSLYHMMPHRPKAYLESCLEHLYAPNPCNHPDTLTQAIVLISAATGSLGTEYFTWGDILFDRVKASLTSFDDVNEQGRPNSAFLHLGTAARKALAAGLHKDVPQDNIETPETIEERRITFWSLYLFETWSCFHAGRPSSLLLKDVAIEYAQDPFNRLLVLLCKTISRSTNEIYGQRHESLLHMWRVSRSITNDLQNVEVQSQETFGFGLDASTKSGSLGVRQTIFITLYYHTILLSFRPFLIFRGRLQQKKSESPDDGPAEIPSWLNEACNHALAAARKTIHHLSEASKANEIVRQLRYHGYFMGSSAFTLIYDFLHEPSAAPTHLPWVYVALQSLTSMRAGDPISSTISAIQTTLRNINPSYEWLGYASSPGQYPSGPEGPTPTSHALGVPDSALLFRGASPSQLDSSQLKGPETTASSGPSEDLLDFTQSNMGWDLDFSTMDLEAFFSVYQSADASLGAAGI